MAGMWAMAAILVTLSVAIPEPVLEPGFDIWHKIGKEIAAVAKQPIEEKIVNAGSSQCENVKDILGFTYEQVKDEKEPDMNLLKLHFKTRDFTSVYIITDAAENLPRAFNPNHKVVIFIHGFTDDPSKASFQNISEAFLEKGGYNIIALDGSPLIKWLYLLSSTYVRFMGEKLGEVLANMVEGGQNPEDILIVGHSLGSHIAGFTGKTFHSLTGQKIGRISSLDPAGPCFSHVDPQLRLIETDADYVDVIHTNAGVFGLKDVVGHADYFVNGGAMQPNCFYPICSHSRAWLYYTESVINEHAFPAKKCKDWATFEKNKCGDTEISYMGFPSKKTTRGVFYLRTDGDVPYGLGENGLVHEDGFLGSVANGLAEASKCTRSSAPVARSTADILIIGHSLGFQTAGLVGKTFSGLTRNKVGRISSLDPAGPCFSY